MNLKTLRAQSNTTCEFVTDPQRKSPRKKVNVPGEISYGDKSQRINCTIIDMSATGARLHFCLQHHRKPTKRGHLNNRISLYLDHRCTNVECEVIWQGQNEAGVEFCSAFHHASHSL